MRSVQTDFFQAACEEPVAYAPDLGLRDYQQGAREGVARVHETHRGALVVLPTGTGKSRLAGAIAWDHKLTNSKVLILCPTIVLCRQMYNDMRKLGLSCAIEQAANFAARPLPDVTVASVATMRGPRLQTFARDAFGLVVADECHRSVSDAYTAIFEHFNGSKRLGLTATPDRTDGLALANVFDAVAYEMTMLDAIHKGWLVPLRFRTAKTDFDPKKLRTLAGEVDAGSAAAELVRSGALHQAANTMAELAGDDRAVAFLPTVASSKAFTAEINARHDRSPNVAQYAAHIDGTTPEQVREEYFAAFAAGTTRVLSNVGVLCEGWDAPHASVIALLNPTRSRSRVCQMIGRGTRLYEGKESTLVIDFCPGRMRKGRLAGPADALAGKMLDDEVAEQLADGGDLAEEIDRAEVKAEELAERERQKVARAKAKAERTNALKSQVKKQRIVYGLAEHDMRELLSNEHSPERIECERERRAKGMASLKMANILRKNGLNPNLGRELAREAIGGIAGNGWRVPESIANDKRFQ